MAELILHQYQSRRNRARLVQRDAAPCVIKTFSDEDAFQTERRIYEMLRDTELPCAAMMAAENKTLVLSQLPGRPLVEWLEEQERTGAPIWEIWDKLVEWLVKFRRQTGFVMTDVNLRNFLYDEATKTLYGLDFEECAGGDMVVPAARIAAYIRTYRPENTPLKQKISRYVLNLFAQMCDLEVDELRRESGRQEAILLERRNK